MRLVQFMDKTKGRRVGVVEGDTLYDLTEVNSQWERVYILFVEARKANLTIEDLIKASLYTSRAPKSDYKVLLARRPGEGTAWLLPPIDHPDPAHCIISGTGLTHLGSMAARDQMHKGNNSDAPKTDSQRMFEMGLEGGRPAPGKRGVSPEWFYKGTGVIMRAHNDHLEIPPFAQDGGEEPEIVGCYAIGPDGTPYRLGFAQANEWSDHMMERVNYLWLAPSKLRTCTVGPELITDQPFQDIRGYCRIYRGNALLYDSGELLTGEQHMSHSLANMEDHHFKHAQFRVPGDVHIYFFGTMKLSFGTRGLFQDGDRIEIGFTGMGAPLVNTVRRLAPDDRPIVVLKG